jgi:hypothetical protein
MTLFSLNPQLAFFFEKILKNNEKTVVCFSGNLHREVSLYVLYIFRKSKDQALKQKKIKMDEFRFLSLAITS